MRIGSVPQARVTAAPSSIHGAPAAPARTDAGAGGAADTPRTPSNAEGSAASSSASQAFTRRMESLEQRAGSMPPDVVHRNALAMRFRVLAPGLSSTELASLSPRLLELVAIARIGITPSPSTPPTSWRQRIEQYSRVGSTTPLR